MTRLPVNVTAKFTATLSLKMQKIPAPSVWAVNIATSLGLSLAAVLLASAYWIVMRA